MNTGQRLLTTAGVALVAVVLGTVLLRPVLPPTSGASPAATSGPSLGVPSDTAPIANPSPSTVPDPTAGSTPFVARSWSLETIAPPPGHPDFDVVGVSARGDYVLFHDADAYDPLYLWDVDEGNVTAVVDDGYEVGTPIFGRFSPDDSFVVFDDTGHLFKFDIGTGHVTAIPDIDTGVRWYVFTSNLSLAALTDLRSDVISPPTQLWALDLAASSAVPVGTRRNTDLMYPSARGVVVQVDTSTQHDGSHLSLYLVDSSGSDSLLYDAGDVASLVISPDGMYAAFSSSAAGQRGSWLVALESGDRSRLSPEGREVSFSPDSRHVEVRFDDGHVTSFARSGQTEASQPNGDQAAWVGHP